jgi:glycosyltransferase involved in cell wall biosynthesis
MSRFAKRIEMPFQWDEVSATARGGTELMKIALADRLLAAGRAHLLDVFDIYSTRVRNFNPTRPSIYWVQDLAVDDETNHLATDRYIFSMIVFVSHWQQQDFQARYPLVKQSQVVLPNAVRLFEPTVLQKWLEPDLGSAQRPIRLVYHTTPHRGLELLVPAFQQAWKAFQQRGIHLHLDVFSSFSIYGWHDRDQQYAGLFDTCRGHPAITYHGAASNDLVRDALRRAHVFAYPCIWSETSCIALIEAMTSGCMCIHSNLAALPETAGGTTICYPHVPDLTTHFQLFTGTLQAVLTGLLADIARKQTPAIVSLCMQRAAAVYNWDKRVGEWIQLLEGVKQSIEKSARRDTV